MKTRYIKIGDKIAEVVAIERSKDIDKGLIFPCEVFGFTLIKKYNKSAKKPLEYNKRNAQYIAAQALEFGRFDYIDTPKIRIFYRYC